MAPKAGEFLWGAASAAYQVEGGWDKDGRGLSKWDIYTNDWHITVPQIGKNHTGNVAINAYDRGQYLNDIALLKELGVDAYRFSISWPRVLPAGIGAVNQPGLDYYSRLVDDLLAAGIKPVVTLYHWDFPWVLHQKGGFHNRDVIGWFTEYAAVIFKALGNRVDTFITMNEPFIDVMMMDLIAENVHAGRTPERFTAAQYGRQIPALHNLFVAAASATAEYRRQGLKGMVGLAAPLSPASAFNPDNEADVDAAADWERFLNRWPLDVAIKGAYGADVLATLNKLAPAFTVSAEDRTILEAGTVDFIGVNFYAPNYIVHNPDRPLNAQTGINPDVVKAHNGPVRPEALHDLLIYLRDNYGDPLIMITENGAGFGPGDEVMADGLVKDPLRADYIRRHIDAVLEARKEGARVIGYMEWCPFDNFEWWRGYDARFGMVHVDFETQKRTPKQSFHAYREIIARHRKTPAA
jgi:beta-glucosidase